MISNVASIMKVSGLQNCLDSMSKYTVLLKKKKGLTCSLSMEILSIAKLAYCN